MIIMSCQYTISIFFFFNDTATTEIYTLSLHDALPISAVTIRLFSTAELKVTCAASCTELLLDATMDCSAPGWRMPTRSQDRKSTRLNSSHANISYAVFCLKKKKIT